MNYSQNINLSDPNDYTHIDKPIARNNNVNPVTWVNFIEFSSVDNFGYGNLSGSIGGTWLTVLDTINNLFKDLNDRLTVVENAINNINPNPNPDPQERTLTSIMWSSTTASSQKGTQISYPSITCVYNDGSTSLISATSTGVTISPYINSSSDANTYYITATYNGKTTTNTLTYTIIPGVPTTYNVTLTVNYGTIANGQAVQTVTSGGSASWAVTPNSGYKMPSSVSGATISGNTVTVSNVTSNQTISLTCEPIPVTQYTVTYNANGGNSTPANQTANAGSTITLASAINRNADSNYTYTFAGWTTQSNGGGTNYTAGQQITLSSNLTLYAKWDAHPKQQTQYYYYAGWTLPTASNVDTIIAETYPTSSSDSTQHAAGKKTTFKSSFSLATVNLYYSVAKTNYYLLVPTGHAIYDTVFGLQMGSDSFTSQGTITVGNQIHTIYKSVGTTRNIGSIEIK